MPSSRGGRLRVRRGYLHPGSMAPRPPLWQNTPYPAGHLPHCASIHGFCGGKRPLSCPPDASAGGRGGACDDAGGCLRRRGASASQAVPRRTATPPGAPSGMHPLYPVGHLPHCVVESVREPRSHVRLNRGHRQHVESLPHHEIPPVNQARNRGSRLRGGECRRSPARTFTESVITANTWNPCTTMSFGQ